MSRPGSGLYLVLSHCYLLHFHVSYTSFVTHVMLFILDTNFLLLHTLSLLQDLSASTPQLFGTFKALPVHVDESLDEDEDYDHSPKTPGKKTFMESMLKAERISHDSAAVTAIARSHVDIHLKVELLNFDNFLESHYNGFPSQYSRGGQLQTN